MGLFESLLGGGQQRQEYQDFIGRYETGAPWDGISDDEAVNRYQQVAGRIPPEMYQESAQEAFSRLSPQQRAEFAAHLRQRAQQQGVNFQDYDQDGVDDRYENPADLARLTSRMQQRQPGLLEGLLGAGGGGAMGGAMGGLSGMLGGGGGGGGAGGMLANPLAKAALAGIAAMAAQRMMGSR
ncbi:MAG: hypothetical protein H0X16_06955 [Chloroflexi bacterium]|nr:hypothetical protein [Chloroflexota bacterium]